MPYGPSQFQSTVIKPYYKDNSSKPLQDALEDAPENTLENALENALKNTLEDALKDTLEKNYNQYTLKGNYDLDIIIINIPQL